MWIRTDDGGWYIHLIWDALWIGTNCLIMLSWPNLKCYVDWKGCDRKLSLSIRSTMWVSTYDKGWCHDLILCDIRIETDVIWCCLVQIKCSVEWKLCDMELSPPIWSTMWISRDDTWWCLDVMWGALWLGQRWNNAVMIKFEVLCGLESMWEDDFTTNLKYYVD
jgi:hypothetical protein